MPITTIATPKTTATILPMIDDVLVALSSITTSIRKITLKCKQIKCVRIFE